MYEDEFQDFSYDHFERDYDERYEYENGEDNYDFEDEEYYMEDEYYPEDRYDGQPDEAQEWADFDPDC